MAQETSGLHNSNQLPKGKPILCLDFDGVCHLYTSGWKGADVIPDPPVPGLFEFLDQCAPFFDLHIFSSRSHQEGGREAMRQWFSYHRFAYINSGKFTHENDVGEAEKWVDRTLKFPIEKPPAFLGLDDRVLNFRGSWPDVEDLRGFKTWTQHPLGAVNTFSRGKLTPEDEGDLRLAVFVKDGTVMIDFGKPVAWLGLDSQTCRELANTLLKRASEVDEKETK